MEAHLRKEEMNLSNCVDCCELDLEYGFTLKQAHSFNHLFRFVNYRTLLYPLRFKGSLRRQLIRKGGKP